ncbi:SDR family NAD(P)-dependent oxidoreductase [Isoptericola halotolerans]|uniref:SDR family NAD(P)-dependent oxidoreductase n=1 Tax=Isoptericola halotolerans TaxID=300560 RepID=UPI00388E8332
MPVALVTGANRGIGRATAIRLADRGYDVVVAARRLSDAHAAVDSWAPSQGRVLPVRLDVTRPEDARAAADLVEDELGGLDVLVNNAGVLPEERPGHPRGRLDVVSFDEAVRTNLLGAVHVTDAFLRLLRESSQGRIVNVSTSLSSMSHQTDPDSPYFATAWPGYQASKAGLNSFTVSLAKLLSGTCIKVTAVCPGFVRTELTPGNARARRTVDEGADVVLRAATLADDAPSGQFIDARATVPW